MEYRSDPSETWTTYWILDHVLQNSEFLKKLFSFSVKTAYLPKNEISLYESIFWSLVRHFQEFCIIQVKNLEK